MEIQTLEVNKINPAVYNPRKDLQPGDPEYDKLKKSILEFDMVEPLVWNKRTGNLVGGHQRLKVLSELGIEKVEVSVVDLSEVKEKALNIALNKIQGEWDFPRLKDLLEELDTGDIDMEITGFDLKEIEDLMTQLHESEPGLTDDDAVPEATESICKRGDLWSLGNHRLLCGDATVITDVEQLMGGEKADMLLTDPPYGELKIFDKKGYVGVDSKHAKAKHYGAYKGEGDFKLEPAMDAVKDKYDKAVIWGGNFFNDVLPIRNSWLCWDKTGGTETETFFSSFELVWTNMGIPSRMFHYLWLGMMRAGERIERVHPTEKPVALSEWVLGKWTKVNDIILDLFGGSGSTLIACEKLGRRCYMMEIDEHYCDVIIERWQQFTGKQAVRIDGN